MKKILLCLVAIFAVNTSFAEDDLKAVMKSMGEQFGVVAQGLRTGKITDVELAAAEKMQRDIAAASLIQPETAVTTDDKLTYATWMAELMEASLRLEDTMEAGMEETPINLSAATAVFVEMNDIRKKGHTQFKTE